MNFFGTDNENSPVNVSFADLTLGVLQYLGSKYGVQDIQLEEKGPAARHELFLWEQKSSCQLPDDIRAFYSANNGFNLTWNAKVDTSVVPVGKMWLNSIQNVSRLGGSSSNHFSVSLADLESDSQSESDEDDKSDATIDRRHRSLPSFNISKSHVFELDPCDGIGKVCLVYQSREQNLKPDIWFLDRALRWHYLAESFSAYYRLMLVNLGLPQWQYAFTDIGLSAQAKQWFHIFAPVRLDLNHDVFAPKRIGDQTDEDYIKIDSDRLFQMTKLGRKKMPSSTSSTTASSAVSQTSSSQSNTVSSLAKKRQSGFTQKSSASMTKFNGTNAMQTNKAQQFK